ncbi:MAG: metallophosphoesterase [Patescibacteria group bacterium]
MKLIVVSDDHLRDDLPICRNDIDWIGVQRDAEEFVYKKAIEHGCTIVCRTGDIFNQSIVVPEIYNMMLDVICKYGVQGVETYILPGNHDLYFHNFDAISKSSFGGLWNIAKSSAFLHTYHDLRDSVGIPYGKLNLKDGKPVISSSAKYVFLHELSFKDEKSRPMQKGFIAQELLDMFPVAQYIFIGDNHRNYVYENNNRYVISPGCLVRQTIDLVDYKAGFYFVDTDKGDIERIDYDDGKLSYEYLSQKKEDARFDKKIENFVDSLSSDGEVSVDFVDNLKREADANSEELGTASEIIYEVLEELCL